MKWKKFQLAFTIFRNRGFFTEFVEIQFSNDKKEFQGIPKINRTSSINSTIIFKENFNFSFQPITARYLSDLHTKEHSNCPSWHQGAGSRLIVLLVKLLN